MEWRTVTLAHSPRGGDLKGSVGTVSDIETGRSWSLGNGRREERARSTPMFRAGLMDLELQPTLASEKSIDFLPTLRVDFETD